MDTSTDSESYDLMLGPGQERGQERRGRETHRRAGRDRSRSRVCAGDGPATELSEKISTLASTLQDTSRNLTKVDQMLGQYREHTDDQAEAMTLLRENLEESINQLQTQRLSRSNGAHSASASTLHTSDNETGIKPDGQRFYPTSPLRDYTTTTGGKRRSLSAVRFKNTSLTGDDIHVLHQSLRDLRCDQQRIAEDLDREILRRNRSDVDTRRAMVNLTDHLSSSQRQDTASCRVEQRLHELEREMHVEPRNREQDRRPDQRAPVSDELQETLERKSVEMEEAMAARLVKAEREKSTMEQELVRARRLLEQSEDSRESLVQQVEDMRGTLLRLTKEKTDHRTRLDSSPSTSQSHGNYNEREEGRSGSGRRGQDRSDLEKEVTELRAELCKASVHNEIEELRRSQERKDKERIQLCLQLEELSSEQTRREQQQLRMLEQLREIQTRALAERRETEELLRESTRSRNELKTRAQEAVCQWRAKCRRLKKELEETRAQAQFHIDKTSQAAKEKESSQAQLKALSQQTETARRELTEILGRLALREDELHRKDVKLSESSQRQLLLEQEIRELKEASAAFREEMQHQADIQAKLREENRRLEEQANTQARRYQRDEGTQAELQVTIKQMTSAHTQAIQRLAEEERSKKEIQMSMVELQAKLTVVQEERAALEKQLQLEREVHKKELGNIKAVIEDSKTKKDREMQDMLRLYQQEREAIQSQMKEVKADAVSDKEQCETLHIKLDRMKNECDKLAAQLSSKEEAYALIQRKYQLLKQEMDDKVRLGELRRASESELIKLEEKLLRMEADQEAVLTSIGDELDVACRSLARNGEDMLQAISQKPGLVKDPHRWLAETKTKLRWLCEEVCECDAREQHLRRQYQQMRDHLKAEKQSGDSDRSELLQRLEQQEKLLTSLSTERKELLEKNRRKDEEMRSLQDRVLDLEMNTRSALDHLESIPEKPCLMENFKDLEESQWQRERVEQRYFKYKEIVENLQHQLDESKRKVQECRDDKKNAVTRSRKLAALSSSIKGPSSFLSSPLGSDTLTTPHKHPSGSDARGPAVNGVKHTMQQHNLE